MRGLAVGVLLATVLVIAAPAAAQQVRPPAPPLRPGPGTITGVVQHPDGSERAGGVPVVLYGLSRDGQPGVANTLTDERGAFRFEGVANDPDMAYLIGARYREIPFFGPRVVFEAGASELHVEIEVSEPTTDTSGVGVAEVIVQLEWAGGRLAVQELHRLRNAAGTVTLVPEAERAARAAPFEAQLPTGAREFLSMAGGFEDSLEEEDGRVRFWGPIYPGGQDLRFQYLVPAPGGSDLALTLRFPSGADRLSVLSSLDGPVFEAADEGAPLLHEDEDVELEGRRFRVRTAEAIARGGRVALRVALPETREDPDALELARADLWVELDDAQLIVNQELRLRVEGTSHLASGAGDDPDGGPPLLRIPLPAGAEGVDLSPEASALGVTFDADALVLRGPVPPGESTLRARYRIAATPEGASLVLRFPRAVPLLNVLVADTGVVIENERLHRRRPFTSGTRVYLHREAFNVEADESLPIHLRRLSSAGISSTASMGVALAAMFAAAWFVMAPLRRERGDAAPAEESPLGLQREAVLQDIRDLDHDFETGKLAEADHTEMRAELRARAIELLRLERGGAARPASPTPASPTPASATPAPRDSARARSDSGDSPRLGAFCPSCGERIDTTWRFCSHCGRTLEAGPEPYA